MKESNNLDVQRYLALKKELENTALEKVKKIEEKLLTKSSESHAEDIQILLMVNDELDDVLLNWEEPVQFSTSNKSDWFDDGDF
jgi:hypothetical protein